MSATTPPTALTGPSAADLGIDSIWPSYWMKEVPGIRGLATKHVGAIPTHKVCHLKAYRGIVGEIASGAARGPWPVRAVVSVAVAVLRENFALAGDEALRKHLRRAIRRERRAALVKAAPAHEPANAHERLVQAYEEIQQVRERVREALQPRARLSVPRAFRRGVVRTPREGHGRPRQANAPPAGEGDDDPPGEHDPVVALRPRGVERQVVAR